MSQAQSPAFNSRPLLTPYRVAILTALGLAGGAAVGADAPKFTPKAELSVKETFDSNVYLQDVGKLDHQESFVTTIIPKVSLEAKIAPQFNATIAYAPEVTQYHDEPSESYVAHRANLNLNGKIKDTAWEQFNSFTWIDGNREGPTFAPPGDIPAVGGIPVRDRREAIVWRNSFKLTQPIGDWFIRPVCSLYEHDFQTRQYNSKVAPHIGYENYIDRQDLNCGLDIGYQVAKDTRLLVGYRYGQQDQFRLLGADSPFDSTYHRLLVGIEGTPADWLKLNVLFGPDIRTWSSAAHQVLGFHPAEMLYWVDAAVTIIPTKQDTLVLSNRRYEQPAFSSQSVYEDITYDAVWRHKCSGELTASAGFRVYIGDWQAPADREDWVYTPYASLAYAFNQHLSGEVSYSYDWVESKVPAKAGREYTRHLGAVGVKYTF
jgi:hypothetical protein